MSQFVQIRSALEAIPTFPATGALFATTEPGKQLLTRRERI
jgi:hypothetical protein